MAERYAEFVAGGLERDANALEWLGRFAECAREVGGPVVDAGCGPGHVVNHLTELGLDACGFDLSPGQVDEALKAYPEADVRVGDLTSLDADDGSLGGLVSRYSIIHMPPTDVGRAFAEWMRVLKPGAPLLVSFFGSLSAAAHGTPFDHAVVTAYELFPAAIAQELEAAGFVEIQVGVIDPPDGGRPLDQATVFARRP